MLEADHARQAQALALILGQLDRFIAHGFEEDGACLEGIGYWNYGLSHYVIFAEMMRARTNGAIDLLAQEKMRAIAEYPATVALGKNVYASFADSHEESSVTPYLAGRLANRTGVNALLGLTGGTASWRITTVLRNLLWWDGQAGALPELFDTVKPGSGIARLVDSTAGRPLVLAAKAGNNAEPHNNNDIGSFIVRIGDYTYLCDPGAGLYSKDYFSGKRYENVFANSYGHSVPRIGGQLQPAGVKFRGSIEQTAPKSVCITFQDAYKVPALQKAVRQLSLADGQVRLEDTFEFSGDPVEVEEAFLTWQSVEVEGSTARIVTPDGTLELRADGAVFAAERLENDCNANHKSGVLTRITLTFPPQPSTAAGVSMIFVPAH
jgi:hypothetical protein